MQRWRWRAEAEELPEFVRQESTSIRLVGIACYPYWLLDVIVYVKAPLLSRAIRRWIVSIDAITGAISVPPPMPPLPFEDKDEEFEIQYIEPKIEVSEIDHDRLQRMAVDQVGRRLRSWMNVKIEIAEAHLVHKEIRMFDVQFKNNSCVTMALDSLKGEYSIVKQQNSSPHLMKGVIL